MQTLYAQIADTVLDGGHSGLRQAFEKRIECLYGIALQSALTQSPANRQALLKEVETLEKRLLAISLDYVEDFEALSPETLLGSFSMAALEMAKMKLEAEGTLLLAGHMGQVFSQLLDMPQITPALRRQMAQPISETLMDFAFARGATDTMSLRLMRYQQG